MWKWFRKHELSDYLLRLPWSSPIYHTIWVASPTPTKRRLGIQHKVNWQFQFPTLPRGINSAKFRIFVNYFSSAEKLVTRSHKLGLIQDSLAMAETNEESTAEVGQRYIIRDRSDARVSQAPNPSANLVAEYKYGRDIDILRHSDCKL